MRILVVEDDLDLRESLAEGLTLEGYLVDSAERGDEADLMLFDVDYDLVVLDLNLPGSTAWRFCSGCADTTSRQMS